MMHHVPWDEEDALRRILAHHQVEPTRKLVNDLAELIKWVHESEEAKCEFAALPPHPLSVRLSLLGIYGKEVLGPPPGLRVPDREPDSG